MSRLRSSPHCLDARLCLTCGYDGAELQGERGVMTFACPSCGADLYARPARSYAEMEGLREQSPDSPLERWAPAANRRGPTTAPAALSPWRRRARWCARWAIAALALIGFATVVLSLMAMGEPRG